MTAFAFAIGEENPNGSTPTETQVKAKATGDTIDLAMEASAELEEEEDAVLMPQEAEDEALSATSSTELPLAWDVPLCLVVDRSEHGYSAEHLSVSVGSIVGVYSPSLIQKL